MLSNSIWKWWKWWREKRINKFKYKRKSALTEWAQGAGSKYTIWAIWFKLITLMNLWGTSVFLLMAIEMRII